MKATIYRTDGTRIEAEGTAEEIARIAQQPYIPTFPLQAQCTCSVAGLCPPHTMRAWPWPQFTYMGGGVTSGRFTTIAENIAAAAQV